VPFQSKFKLIHYRWSRLPDNFEAALLRRLRSRCLWRRLSHRGQILAGRNVGYAGHMGYFSAHRIVDADAIAVE
jgi:hypothetical protein